MDDLIENTFSVERHRDFIRNLFGPHITMPFSGEAYVVYAWRGTRPRLICGAISSRMGEWRSTPSFQSMLTRYTSESFMDLVFLTTAFGRNTASIDTYFRTQQSESSWSIVDDICRQTRGYVLYNDQMNRLLSLFTHDRQRVDKIRRGWKTRKPYAHRILARLTLADEESSLLQILNDRALLGATQQPNLYGARLLYDMYSLKTAITGNNGSAN